MQFQEMSHKAFKQRDLSRVRRNENALREARIRARDDGEAFDEARWMPPEPEPDNVVFAGGQTVVLVTREKGDPYYTDEQVAAQVRDYVGQRQDFDPEPGSVNA